ncbi:MAG: cytochrome c biogenesis protein CcdA [Candidatus Pacebacteria bacterium]|nr:cytochrome c biogenesis protein CcdA [Candidatus Paceibacterota bacterium]
MSLLISTSLIIAFIAGAAALFAPCCIAVLLPVYFASVFKQRTKVFFMTFVFFLGILIVFLPLGLGFGSLGSLFVGLHEVIFLAVALFLLFLGLSTLLGFHLRLPFHVSPKIKNNGTASIFFLGILSGLATTCCAPVLAGVLALSVLPASTFWGLMYSLSYVLGMVIPLFVIALFLDKFNIEKKFSFFTKTVSYNLGQKKIILTVSNLISSAMFLSMGFLILALEMMGKLRVDSSFQISVNIFAARVVNSVSGIIESIPGFWIIIVSFFLLMTFILVKKAISQVKNKVN